MYVNQLLGSYVKHVQHTARISRVQYNEYRDTDGKATKPFTWFICDTRPTDTSRISNDERVLYNDTETLMVKPLSHLLDS